VLHGSTGVIDVNAGFVQSGGTVVAPAYRVPEELLVSRFKDTIVEAAKELSKRLGKI